MLQLVSDINLFSFNSCTTASARASFTFLFLFYYFAYCCKISTYDDDGDDMTA